MFDKDEQRIAEERGGVTRPAPRTLASAHLLQALNALDDACSPVALFRPRRTWPLTDRDSLSARRTRADIIQCGLCRTATLFTACAAEAFVNDFLAVHLKDQVSAEKFNKIDRSWPTLRKYLEAVPMAYAPFFADTDGDEVIPHLKTLFKMRNTLVHARPGVGPPMAWMPDPTWRDQHPPVSVARWIVAVAGAAEVMEMRCYGFDYASIPADAIWHGRRLVYERATWAHDLPPHDAPDPTPLYPALNINLEALNAGLSGARLAVHDLRDARIAHAEAHGSWDAFTDLVMRQRGRAERVDETSSDRPLARILRTFRKPARSLARLRRRRG